MLITVAVNAAVLSFSIPSIQSSNTLFILLSKSPYISFIVILILSSISLFCLEYVLESWSNEILIKRKAVNKEYEGFSLDAKTLLVIAGDLDFLLESRKQKEIFCKLRDNCCILYTGSTNDKTKEILSELSSSNVKMRISDNNSCLYKLRGQIKEDCNGHWKLLLFAKVEGKKHKYKRIIINNGYIVSIVKDTFSEEFSGIV